MEPPPQSPGLLRYGWWLTIPFGVAAFITLGVWWNQAPEDPLHYGPTSSQWSDYVDGCVTNCLPRGTGEPSCKKFCDCCAKALFASMEKAAIDHAFQSFQANTPETADFQRLVTDIAKTCQERVGGKPG